MMIGLQAINIEMVTAEGTPVNIPIEPPETRLIQQINNDDDLIPKIAYLQYKYGISAECRAYDKNSLLSCHNVLTNQNRPDNCHN